MSDSPSKPPAPGALSDPRLGGELLEALALGVGGFVLAALLGVGLALWLRRRELAWTWALLGLPVALTVWLAVVMQALVLPLTTSALLAPGALGFLAGSLGWGVHARLEDRRAGGDRESAARERRGLFDLARRRLAQRRARRGAQQAGTLPVGRTRREELASIPRGSAASGSHVLIPGATGAGKTTSLAALLVEYVVRSGFGAVVLEAKSDRVLRAAAEQAAAARGVAFHCISTTGPTSYDPLAQGSIDERSERLVAVHTWGSDDASFYRQAASPFLRLVLRGLAAAGRPVTLESVARYCDADELENFTHHHAGRELLAEVKASVDGLRNDEKRAIAGLRARLRNLATSDFAQAWLRPADDDGEPVLDLRAAIRRREVVYFRFDTDRTGHVGRGIAQMALLDLGAAASALMGAGVGTFVAIDEFGALEAPALDRLFARSRAAGFSVAVGTQTLADLRAAGEAVRERIGATVSAILCHRLGEQADAEWVAQLIGAVPAWQSTIRTNRLGVATDEGTRTRGYRFEVNPSQLQRLGPGEAYVARLDATGERRAARARVVTPWERLPTLVPG